MSALRISRPGQETLLIDQGPSNSRPWGARSIGGQMVTARHAVPLPVPATTGQRRAQIAAYHAKKRAEAGGECGLKMKRRSGYCALVKGHKDSCRTRDWMDRKAAEVRSSRRGVAFTLHPENRR